ncbi:MAG: tetratricopeptide repeat protein [Pseudomonadota bacterium]
MRQPILIALLCGGAVVLSGCDQFGQTDVSRAIAESELDESGSIREIMLTVAEPREATAYFQRQMEQEPDNIEHIRGFGKSLVRGGRQAEAVLVWQKVVAHPDAEHADSVALADVYIRTSDWASARATLDSVPPTYESFTRYRLEAMVADSAQQWERADSFYETALGLAPKPAGVLNNWGYSKLTRGDSDAAERLFTEAITHNPDMFTAKNNLVLARAARRDYRLPVMPLDQEERARLLHTAGIAAVRQGDVDIGRNLLQDAIDTHPRHFEAAKNALAALDA